MASDGNFGQKKINMNRINVKNRSRHCIFLILIALFIVSCGSFETTRETGNKDGENGYWPTDAWRVVSPDEKGMDAALLQQMLAEIEEEELEIDSVVVVYDGYIVKEKYYPPYKQDNLHEIFSITKGIVSALIGIGIEEGFINSVDEPVLDFFPERTFQNNDSIKQSITLEHLLTMSSGLIDESNGLWRSQDWVQHVLDQPMYIEPGKEFSYNSGNTHVLSAIIQRTSGMNTREFAEKYLFDPLGITDIKWDADPDGIYTGGWGMAMKSRDLARIGYLYLKQGKWDDRQIVPAEWIKATTERHIQVAEPLEPWDLYMGYSWWIHADGPIAAHGAKGQFIYVIPESDLIVIFTGNISDAEFAYPQMLIREFIIPAVSETNQ